MGQLFSIGEMAKLFNINIRTLRYYDSIGLLKPEFVDRSTNYRYYSTKQFEKLNTIKYLRALDMPIEKIEIFFNNKDVSVMQELLNSQKLVINEKKRQLDIIEGKIEKRLSQINDAVKGKLDEIIIKELPERNVIALKNDIPVEDDLEYSIRKLEQNYNLNASVFLGKIGVSISCEDILKGKYTSFSSIFLLIEEEDCCGCDSFTLPKGKYACIRFCGTHRESSGYYEKIKHFLNDNGLKISGDSVEITMIDSGMTNTLSEYVTELQVPFAYK